jgi:hypothetical protein
LKHFVWPVPGTLAMAGTSVGVGEGATHSMETPPWVAMLPTNTTCTQKRTSTLPAPAGIDGQWVLQIGVTAACHTREQLFFACLPGAAHTLRRKLAAGRERHLDHAGLAFAYTALDDSGGFHPLHHHCRGRL